MADIQLQKRTARTKIIRTDFDPLKQTERCLVFWSQPFGRAAVTSTVKRIELNNIILTCINSCGKIIVFC